MSDNTLWLHVEAALPLRTTRSHQHETHPPYIASQVATCAFDYNGNLTVCTLTLKSGFKSVGYSSCMDAKNYDREAGEQAAHKDALNKFWDHEAYFFYKLGLNEAKGIIDERLGVAVNVRDHGEKFYQPWVSVTVYTQPDPKTVNVTNNVSRLFLDPASVAAELGKTPEFGRDVINIILKSREKLGLATGGYVGGKKDGAE